MQRIKILFPLSVMALFALNCASGSNSKELLDEQGKVIGRYDRLNDREAKASFDMNRNGVHEKVSNYKDAQLTSVEYYDDSNGTQTKTVGFKDGKPATVQVFDKNGKAIRGDVLLDSQKGTTKEVTLPEKNKKVIFNGDGTVSISDVK
ncbi:MAG TPA: hypothetical protein PLY93_13080 [Turneriella sp.]|nr:hypothetical protein [Turneriella sp.]